MGACNTRPPRQSLEPAVLTAEVSAYGVDSRPDRSVYAPARSVGIPPVGAGPLEGSGECLDGPYVGVCLEELPQDQGTPNGAPTWSYAGQRRGHYELLSTYEYVGRGNGSFDVEPSPQPGESYTGLKAFTVTFSAALLILLLAPQTEIQREVLFARSARWVHKSSERIGRVTKEWDLKLPAVRWKGLHFDVPSLPNIPGGTNGTDAPAPTPVSVSMRDAYDCSGGAARAVQGAWSGLKKDWCCRHQAVGCPPGDENTYNCEEGRSDWEKAWSSDRKDYCCGYLRDGCVTSAAPAASASASMTPALFDCKRGFQDGWSLQQRAWCCQQTGMACPQGGGGLRR